MNKEGKCKANMNHINICFSFLLVVFFIIGITVFFSPFLVSVFVVVWLACLFVFALLLSLANTNQAQYF